MARIKYSSIVSEVAGSVGSATFQRNAYGSTLRNKPSHSKNSTQHLRSYQSYLSDIAKVWKALTDSQKDIWNRYNQYARVSTKFNKASLLTGRNLFYQFNTARLIGGLTILEVPSFLPCSIPSDSFEMIVTEVAVIVESITSVDYSNVFVNVSFKPIYSTTISVPCKKEVILSAPWLGTGVWFFSETWLKQFFNLPVVGDTFEVTIKGWNLTSPVGITLYSGPLTIQ